MQHPVSKLALLALLCLASTRVHGARPIQPIFHLADFSHPLVIDDPYLSLPAGRHIVFYEVKGGECAVNDFVVTADTKSDFQANYGVAEDLARVERTHASVTTGLGEFGGCVVTREWTRLSPGDIEYKSYCPTVGLVLVEHSGQKGGAEAVDLGL